MIIHVSVEKAEKPAFVNKPYFLLITIGTAKYASEEREIVASLINKGINVLTVYPDGRVRYSRTGILLSITSILKVDDYAWAMYNWFKSIISGTHNLFFCESKKRSLFVASISSIRHYFISFVLSERIIALQGLPIAVLSLCPFSGTSVAIVDNMKKHRVMTAGIRTQSTALELEHASINTDILFCKSLNEKSMYKKFFLEDNPILVDACLLSTPEDYHNDLLILPHKYVLVLGTGIASGQNLSDYIAFNERLICVAAKANLPIVFKGHNLAIDFDNEWFAKKPHDVHVTLRITDLKYNRQLINDADLIISPYSTLLYYVILQNKPFIIVETDPRFNPTPDEFQMAPITRINWGQPIELLNIDWTALNISSYNASIWFKNIYFIEKNADYLVNYLIEYG